MDGRTDRRSNIQFAPVKQWLFISLAGLIVLLVVVLVFRTRADLLPIPEKLAPEVREIQRFQVLDRRGAPLSVTYQNSWNFHETLSLHEIPPLMVRAFVESEDRRFYEHSGVDRVARIHAAVQNVRAFRVVRGASTISEQVVRMLHPRPRTFWSRWLEGIEAQRLEQRFTKAEILEFYLNQVPYGHQRRGVMQAARFYFDRDPATLSPGEILALVVLVRAPGRMDLLRDNAMVKLGVARLAGHLRDQGVMGEEEVRAALGSKWSLEKSASPVEAGHFVRFVRGSVQPGGPGDRTRVTTSLDGGLQARIQGILDTRLRDFPAMERVDGAVLVVDHARDEVLAWVNGGGLSTELPGGWIDAVTAPRQPGSTLKPFLYALSLESGWTPATLIEDTPLAEPVAQGLHRFHNYSRIHYGPLRLREALGNSLNVPAVRTIQFTGRSRFLKKLHELGFESLDRPADHYGDGLALGDGEVSLLELVRAYAVLARGGEVRPLKTVLGERPPERDGRRVFDRETAALIGDILSDPHARHLEFGDGHLLRFPVQTAVKTGTSSDHRDGWAVGFTHRHTAGVWMGNLERKPARGLTGASGPALVLRAVFAELNRLHEPEPLPVSPGLVPMVICRETGLRAGPLCPAMKEVFRQDNVPEKQCPFHRFKSAKAGRAGFWHGSGDARAVLVQPTRDLQLRMDPRIPDELEAFPLAVSRAYPVERIEWFVDGNLVGDTGPGKYRFPWKLSRGPHLARARVWGKGLDDPQETMEVSFLVK